MFHSANDALSADAISSLLKESGLSENSALEKQIIPELIRGKDLLIEADSSERKAAPLFLPILASLDKRSGHLNSLLLTTNQSILNQAEYSFRKLAGKRFKNRQITILGKETQARKELRLLAKRPSTIVGTPERIIDHLRRGNLDLSRLDTMVFDVPEEEERHSFEQDVEFIISKVPNHPKSAVYTTDPEQLSFLPSFQRRPSFLSRDSREEIIPWLYRFTTDKKLTKETVRVLLERGPIEHCLVFVKSISDLNHLKEALKESNVHVSSLKDGPEAGKAGCFLTAADDSTPLVPGIRSIIFSGYVPDKPVLDRIMKESLEDPEHTDFLLIHEPGDAAETKTKQLEEEHRMSIEEKELPKDEDVLKGYIANILHSIKVEEDPEILNAYRKMVRKHVPFFMRSYFSAYMLKHSGAKLPLESGVGRGKPSKRRKPGKEGREQTNTSEMKTLFVSIGKNRRVYPKDLVQLFRSTLDLEKEEVGAVKVLDNYSFVEIAGTKAETAISKMDGMEFRSRNITVNHARKK